MPKCFCDLVECAFNHGGECDNEEIELDYTGACQSFEQKSGEVSLEPA